MIGLLAGGGYDLYKNQIDSLLKITFFGLSFLVVIRLLWALISPSGLGAIQASFGDIVKYTITSPKNIAVRDKIA